MPDRIGMSTARKNLDSSLLPAFGERKAGQRRCSCDECKEVIDVLNDIEEAENDFAIERWKNEELARLNYA